MRLYETIIECGDNAFKACGTAENEKEFKSIYGGNGDFIVIRDITKKILDSLDVDYYRENLKKIGYNDKEITLLVSLLEQQLTNI